MSSDSWMPHGFCFLWNPAILSTSVVSDALIAIAYFAIAMCLGIARSRLTGVISDTELARWAFASFATFIFACGATHIMDIIVVWQPLYTLQVIIKVITAVASLTTAVILVTLVRLYVRMLVASRALPADGEPSSS